MKNWPTKRYGGAAMGVAIGLSAQSRILVVAHADTDDDIRIISAARDTARAGVS